LVHFRLVDDAGAMILASSSFCLDQWLDSMEQQLLCAVRAEFVEAD
jgi:hypothetical protein